MVRLVPLLCWLVLLVVSAGCSSSSRIDYGRLLVSGRDGWQHPEQVVASLGLEPGHRVAEIGAGAGYWLPWLSEAVGENGLVLAVEVEPELVEKLERRVAREGYTNVRIVLGEYADPKLPDGSIDLAMTSLTYHHIEARVAYFRALQTDLAEGGRVVHLDDRPDSPAPISWFQSEGHWTDPTQIADEMAAAGYTRTAVFDFLPAQSFQIFRPESKQAAHHSSTGF